MAGKFVDSNIWIYSFVQTDDPDKTITAQTLIKSLSSSVISTQVISEVSCNLLRKSVADESLIQELIVDFYKRHLVVDLTKSVSLTASELRAKLSVSYWDSLILSAALESDCDVLFTEDLQHRQVIEGTLRIVNPFLQP